MTLFNELFDEMANLNRRNVLRQKMREIATRGAKAAKDGDLQRSAACMEEIQPLLREYVALTGNRELEKLADSGLDLLARTRRMEEAAND